MSAERPLTGKRIIVTRAREQASSLVKALEGLDAEVIELPTIEIVPLGSYEALDTALRSIADYQWLVVTSANTVRVLVERLAVLDMQVDAFASLKKAAIGAATARTMREHRIDVDVTPQQYVADSLLAALGDRLGGSRILLARASVARDVIPEELTRRGAVVDVVDAYRTVVPGGAAEQMREVFSDPSRWPDAVTFTSSSTVKNFFALWNHTGLGPIPTGLLAVSIGPVTSATLRESRWGTVLQAEQYDVEGLVEALVENLAGSGLGT